MKKQDIVLDYTEYKRKQIGRSKKKWGKTHDAILNFEKQFENDWYQVRKLINPKIIGCMGIKSGAEYKEFKKYLPNAKIYGVDIVPDVVNVGTNCFCYDFSELPVEWGGKFDLVYSNSLDHAFDVNKTIREWGRVTKVGGYLLMVLSTSEGIHDVDIYQFEKNDMLVLFNPTQFELIKMWDHEYEFCVLLKKI